MTLKPNHGQQRGAVSIMTCGDAERLRRISPEVRALVLGRYPSCLGCGSDERRTLDHVIPLTRGGDNDPSNLQVLCLRCNSRKNNMTMAEWIEYEVGRGRWNG